MRESSRTPRENSRLSAGGLLRKKRQPEAGASKASSKIVKEKEYEVNAEKRSGTERRAQEAKWHKANKRQ